MDKVLVGKFEAENKVEEKMLLERRILLEALQSNGIDAVNIDCKWPKDSFISHSGKVYKRKNYGFYADGGYVLNNDEFTLACSEVSFSDDMYTDTPDERYKLLQNLYGKNIFILPPPDKSLNFNLSPHIDLVVLPILERKLLFVDFMYYRTNHESLGLLCDKYNLTLKIVPNDYSKPSYPCNSLLIRNNGRISVVTNEINNKNFILTLRDYGLDIIDIPFEANCANGGSVHCATNTIPENYTGNIEDLL